MAESDRERLCAGAAVVVPLLALVATAPFGAHPVNADWQTYWSAFRFAATGEVRVPDYSAMGAVGWTVPAGAVAGASFVLRRVLTMATLGVAGWAAWRLAREFGVRPGAA